MIRIDGRLSLTLTAMALAVTADLYVYYYDPSKYSTYLEQLGISYPTVRTN